MGEVFLVEDKTLCRKVALKLLPAEFAADPKWITRFMTEARTISALNHPNILTIYGLGESNGIHFLATKYVEGSTLRKKIGNLDLGTILDIARQLAAGLGAAHQAGIVHRDIKPANLILRPDGVLKILDFGLAKHDTSALAVPSDDGTLTLSGLADHTLPGTIKGTPNYMSPEQVLGLHVDARSDIFSAGVVLYEIMTGRKPFESKSIIGAMQATVHSAPRPLPELRPDLPLTLRRLVEKVLEKNPGHRQQSMQELAAEIPRSN